MRRQNRTGAQRRPSQNRRHGRRESGQILPDQPIPLRHLLHKVQAHRGGDAPWPLQRGRSEPHAGHLGYLRGVRVPRDASPLDFLGGRFHPGVRCDERGYVRRGQSVEGPNTRDQGWNCGAHRRGGE